MTAFTVVRFRAKPGQEANFERKFRELNREMNGLRRFVLVKTGERDYCSVRRRASKTGLNGVSVARQERVNPPHAQRRLASNRCRRPLGDARLGCGIRPTRSTKDSVNPYR